ncbi:MAG: TIGR04282 family arsenosugar biosynthesis glycosyltransferase, partial [Flavobacteriales bacterium]|nr:TIGR04282 family arsenosugar biosynthesis glycosyltransferase [Flavobacteriales bacterium]
VFVKNSELGLVKTRLAKTVGDENALRIYKALIQKTKEVILNVSAQKSIYYSSYIDDYDQFDPKDFAKRLQMGDDLGERMKNTFEAAFNQGAEKAIILGSDCWQLRTDIIDQAFDALDRSDMVIGPAEDGGYYLLGMKKFIPEVFEDKEWSTSNVLVDTLLDIQKKGMTREILETLSDVDFEEDLPKALRLLIQ